MSENLPTIWFNCPFCSCRFLSSRDLSRHLKTFIQPPSVYRISRINSEDHQKLYIKCHENLEKGLDIF